MFCEVYLLDVPYHLDRPFDYECNADAEVGAIVNQTNDNIHILYVNSQPN